MARAVRRLNGHFIVCGYGRVGRAISSELRQQKVPHMVIDATEDGEDPGVPTLIGDATDDETLRRAGIERAQGLVSVLGSDAENMYAVVTARSLRSDLYIMARCGEDRSANKLLAAGADRVINPYERSGVQMAQILTHPQVVDFMEEVVRGAGFNIYLAQIEIDGSSPLVGMRLRESPIRRELDIIVTAIVNREGRRIFNPSPDERIEAGDVLITMGRPDDQDRLQSLAEGR